MKGGVLVQKFGGSSLADDKGREVAVSQIRRARNSGRAVVVVVSAMGRKGDPYATDTLLDLACTREARPSLRELDLLMSCGETIAATVLACRLQAVGISAVALTGAQAGFITDDSFSGASIEKVKPSRLRRCLREGKVAVVAGFQGITENGDITTLGRGGSDITAAAVGAALGAESVQIFTDVRGVKTVDPTLLSNAKILREISYTTMEHLARHGARVLHWKAVAIAKRVGIALEVLPHGGEGGTMIAAESELRSKAQKPLPSQGVRGVAHKENLVCLRVPENRIPNFAALRQEGVTLGHPRVGREKIAFTVPREQEELACRLLVEHDCPVQERIPCGKVVLVTEGRWPLHPALKALNEEAIIPREAVVCPDTIVFLLAPEDVPSAVKVLAEKFDLLQQGGEK